MKKNKAEYLWLIGVAMISFLIGSQIFGLKSFFDWVIDINIHDTYFVVDSINGFLSLISLLTFLVFLPRIIIHKFQNKFSNFVFLFANGYMIFFITFLISIVMMVSTTQLPTSDVSEQGWTVYPPMNAGISPINENDYIIIRQILVVTQICLIILFGFVAFKSGLKIKKQSA